MCKNVTFFKKFSKNFFGHFKCPFLICKECQFFLHFLHQLQYKGSKMKNKSSLKIFCYFFRDLGIFYVVHIEKSKKIKLKNILASLLLL